MKEGSALFWLLTLYHNVKFALFALLLRVFGLPDLATKLWEGWQVRFPIFCLIQSERLYSKENKQATHNGPLMALNWSSCKVLGLDLLGALSVNERWIVWGEQAWCTYNTEKLDLQLFFCSRNARHLEVRSQSSISFIMK